MRRLPSKPPHILAEEIRREANKRLKLRLIIEFSILGVVLFALGIISLLNSSLVDNLKYKLNDVDCTVSFPDMEYGDSVFIECEGETALIDSGTKEHGKELMSFIASNNINKLDYIFVSDIDEGYIGVLEDIMNTVEVFRVVLPSVDEENSLYNEIDNLAFMNGIQAVTVNDGQTFPLFESYFSVVEYESLSLKFWFGNNSFVFWNTSDESKEIDFIESISVIDSDVLWIKNDNLPSDRFLETVSPQICVVSGGDNISAVSVLEKFAEKVYKTNSNGDIVIFSDEVDLETSCEIQ